MPFAYHKVFRKKPAFRKAAVLSKEHTTATNTLKPQNTPLLQRQTLWKHQSVLNSIYEWERWPDTGTPEQLPLQVNSELHTQSGLLLFLWCQAQQWRKNAITFWFLSTATQVTHKRFKLTINYYISKSTSHSSLFTFPSQVNPVNSSSWCSLYWHACQVRVTVGDSGLCCLCVRSFKC